MFTNIVGCWKSIAAIMQSLFLIILLGSYAQAQSTGGIIEGSVQDGTSARLPGAAVTIVNEETKQALQTVTNAEGNFRFTSLPVGKYRLETTLTGFAKNILQAVEIVLANPAKFTITLVPAGLTETVNIAADG